MRIDGSNRRSIWLESDRRTVGVIDQTTLPFEIRTRQLGRVEDVVEAIGQRIVGGVQLIGVAGAFGMALAMRDSATDAAILNAELMLKGSSPSPVTLGWAVDWMVDLLTTLPPDERAERGLAEASHLAEEDVATSQAIGRQGLGLIQANQARHPGRPVNILTHGQGGWLACVDWGGALAPVYMAHRARVPVHVWVCETRPSGVGARITAFELAQEGVPHTLIADAAAGRLLREGLVDLVMVGAERATERGDMAATVGTYSLALAAHDQGVPVWVALPGVAIDWGLAGGPLNLAGGFGEREEVTHLVGLGEGGAPTRIRWLAEGAAVHNPRLDVTPARLITGFLTERGRCPASDGALAGLYPEQSEADGGVA